MSDVIPSYRLDKWEVCQVIYGGPMVEPMCFVVGNVTGHPNHPEQSRVRTSPIEEMEFGEKACIAYTRNSAYVLPYKDARVPFNPLGGSQF